MGPERFALIIGAMKCGTTSLFQHLGTHPEIAPCREKEPNFFCADGFRPEDLDRYRSLWDWQPGRHRIAVEASVNYSKLPAFPDCAERISRCPGLDFRFVYCMRNPIDRIESHLHHGVHAGWTGRLDEGVPEHAVNVSRYAMQLDAYASRFGRDGIFLVVLEDFEAAPEPILARICEHLGVDPGFDFSEPQTSYNRASEHYVEHPAWARLRSLEPLRRLAGAVPVGLRRRIHRATGRTVEARRRLTAAERSELAAALRPDLIRLRSEYGIDAPAKWGIELP